MSNKVSDNLHRLIKSLSKPEKRYFKIYASRHTLGEENNYIRLFDAIDKQAEYDEGAILKKFSKDIFINKYAIAKSRLYDQVLRSLDAFHANSSIDAQLKRDLHCAEILYKKTLYEQCARLLSSAKKLALKFEKHSTLLEIHDWEKKLIEKDNYAGHSDEDIIQLLKEDQRIAERIRNFNEYWNIKSRFFMFLNKKGKVRNQEELSNFKKIIDNTLLKVEPEALSTETKYLLYHIYSAYYFGIGDYQHSYENLQKNVELIESHTDIFREEPNIYFSILTNIIYVASQLKHYEEVFNYLKKLREVPQTFDIHRNEDLEIKLFSSANSIEITLYNNMGDYEKALALLPSIEEGLKRFSGKLNKLREAYFFFNIAVAFFGTAKYSLALKWNNKLLNNEHIEESQDIHCFSMIFNLIIHLELKNDELIPYTYKSLHRYLSTRNRVYNFETTFMNFVAKLMKTKNHEEQLQHYTNLYQELLPLSKDNFERSAFEYFDFLNWAKSKMEGISFRELAGMKAS
jgi:hypothetical protein